MSQPSPWDDDPAYGRPLQGDPRHSSGYPPPVRQPPPQRVPWPDRYPTHDEYIDEDHDDQAYEDGSYPDQAYDARPAHPGGFGPASGQYPAGSYDPAGGRTQVPPMAPGGEAPGSRRQPVGRRDRRSVAARRQAQAREMRWHRNRLAVPYYTDGPKVTFGVLWFLVLVAAMVTSPLAVAAVGALVAGLAGLQTGLAWFPQHPATKWWTAGAGFVVAMAGALGPLGIVAGAGLGTLLLLVYMLINPVHSRSTAQLLDVLVRSALPAGVAAGSLAALMGVDLGALLLLVALVSAYEVGDFLVGSGSTNAVEGPVSGMVALAAVGFVAWILAPAPFTTGSVVMFAALAGVCCPLGQILAAALLPRGSAWAPALRRLDSYLLAAPLWLLLLAGLSGSSTL